MLGGALCRGINPLIENIKLLPTQGHFPDLEQTINAFLELPELRSSIMLYLAGWGLNELGIKKYGKPVQKFTEGYLKGLAIQHLLYHSTHSEKGAGLFGKSEQNLYNRAVRDANLPQDYSPTWAYVS